MFTKEKIEAIQILIKSKIKEIEEAENVKINFGSISYNSANYHTKMTVTTNEITDVVENANKILSKKYGFIDNIIGMEFEHSENLGVIVITEIRTRNRKFPIIGQSKKNGNLYKFEVDRIKKFLPNNVILRNKNLEKLLDGRI